MKDEKVAFVPLTWLQRAAKAAAHKEKIICYSFKTRVTDPISPLANRQSARFVKAA